MKKFGVLGSLLFWGLHVAAQELPSAKQLTDRTWILDSHTMSGVGKHESVPKNTELQFSPDGKWRASAPLEGWGVAEGQWAIEKGQLHMQGSGQTKNIELVLDGGKLRFKIRSKLSTYVYEWTAR
jgi:hypothetical protein